MKALATLAGILAGCTSYTHTSMHSAPGLADLDTPMPREIGTPEVYAEPTAPPTDTIAVFAIPYVALGSGRLDTGSAASEVGFELRIERTFDKDGALLHDSGFALTTGVGLAQFYDNRPTIFGATYAELNYRLLLSVVPMDVGMGVAAYPGVSLPATMEHHDAEIGGQLTVRFPILSVRARYMSDTGPEVMAGFSIPVPFFFGRSR
jgi:hypothetical protein